MSKFYPYEIMAASYEERPKLVNQHDNAILKMTLKVGMKVVMSMAYIAKDDRTAQAEAFARVLAVTLRHVPTGHLDEIREPLIDACLEQISVNPEKRPSAYVAMCDVHMLCAIPGLWSFVDLCGGYQSPMRYVRGASAVAGAALKGELVLDQSNLWLEWAEKGFGPWGTGPKVGNEWDDWTPPSTPIKLLWDRTPEEERKDTCWRALIYLQRGIKLAFLNDEKWKGVK